MMRCCGCSGGGGTKRKTLLISISIITLVILFIQLSDIKYRPLVVYKSNENLKMRLCPPSEIVKKRREWGEVEHLGWHTIRFVKREDGIFSHIIRNNQLHDRTTLRLWVQFPFRFAKQIYHTIVHGNAHVPHWKEFDVLGPVFPELCHNPLKLGTGDEEKILCWDYKSQFEDSSCVVLSFGSNNQWMFEESIKNKTKCSVYTFDCTVSRATPPPGVYFYPYCIDAMSYTNGQGLVFKSIQDIVNRIGLQKKRIDYLKLDVEGFEFETLVPFLKGLHDELLPPQIAVEIHYQASKFDLDQNVLLAFGNFMFYEVGYVITYRRDNALGYFASEFLFQKINC